MSVLIKEVISKKELKGFIAFPEKLYKDCPNWVNALWTDEYQTLLKDKNPAFEFCEAWYFLAVKENEVVGRVAAIINHHANRDWNENHMRFGWLDFIDDYEVSTALIGKVESLAKEKGMSAVSGPFGFSDMDREGLLVSGFENLGSLTTLYNFPYYQEHLEKLNYVKDADWSQLEFEVPDKVPEKFRKYSDIVQKRYGIRILHPKSRRELKCYGRGLLEALNKSFVPLYGFTPLNSGQIESYVSQYLPMIKPDLICIILDKHDTVVGFAVTMPNLSNALKKSKGKLFPFGFIHLLRALNNFELVDLLMIGVVPEYHHKGLNAIIFNHLNSNLIKLGTKRVIANPQLEKNTAVRNLFDYYPHRDYMVRRCFIKELGLH